MEDDKSALAPVSGRWFVDRNPFPQDLALHDNPKAIRGISSSPTQGLRAPENTFSPTSSPAPRSACHRNIPTPSLLTGTFNRPGSCHLLCPRPAFGFQLTRVGHKLEFAATCLRLAVHSRPTPERSHDGNSGPPDGVRPVGAFQIVFEWTKKEKSLIVFFFQSIED